MALKRSGPLRMVVGPADLSLTEPVHSAETADGPPSGLRRLRPRPYGFLLQSVHVLAADEDEPFERRAVPDCALLNVETLPAQRCEIAHTVRQRIDVLRSRSSNAEAAG